MQVRAWLHGFAGGFLVWFFFEMASPGWSAAGNPRWLILIGAMLLVFASHLVRPRGGRKTRLAGAKRAGEVIHD